MSKSISYKSKDRVTSHLYNDIKEHRKAMQDDKDLIKYYVNEKKIRSGKYE